MMSMECFGGRMHRKLYFNRHPAKHTCCRMWCSSVQASVAKRAADGCSLQKNAQKLECCQQPIGGMHFENFFSAHPSARTIF